MRSIQKLGEKVGNAIGKICTTSLLGSVVVFGVQLCKAIIEHEERNATNK